MAAPPDFMQAIAFPNVTSIRTSGDYRYRLGSAFLWAWFLFGGALARALGLLPYKDVFFSSREGAGADGDPHAEVEALLAALSAGPVGIGDRLGRADPELVLRTCRADGVLVKPDAPLAALERCYWTRGSLAPAPLLAETFSQHPAGRTVYLVALHTGQGGALRERVPLAELSLAGPVLCWDWRRGEAARIEPGGAVELELAPLAWDYRILCPLLPGGIAVVGDPARYASAGDRRLRAVRAVPGGVAFSVLGTPGERVEIAGWSEGPLELVEARGGEVHERLPNASADARLDRDPACGVFRVQLALSRRGRVDVRLGA